MKSKKKRNYLKIIKQIIENVRSKNNKNWMDLYRLAFSKAPEQSIEIIKKNLKKDKEISQLVEKLLK